MNCLKNIFTLIIALLLFSCKTTQLLNFEAATSVEATVTNTGLLDAYISGLKADSVNYVYSEASAVMKIGDNLLIAIDKPVPGKELSPVFSVPIAAIKNGAIANNQISYITNIAFQEVQKIEAFAKSQNDSVFFATTAFDRIKGKVADWDGYNSLLAWRAADFSDVEYVAGTARSNVLSSMDLRSSIQKTLITSQFPQGAPYFKIEALAVLPGNRLIFGVREIGESYQKFEYAFTLLETTYTDSKNGIKVSPTFKKIYEYQPVVNGQKMGISDLTYHAKSNSLIVMTSYEELGDEKTKALASSLWILPLSKLAKGEAPIPVMNKGKQLYFLNKAEGITLLDDRTLFIIFDEDRKDSQVKVNGKMVTKRPHQAIYSIVKF